MNDVIFTVHLMWICLLVYILILANLYQYEKPQAACC